jgi:catecholate siderophore receptor
MSIKKLTAVFLCSVSCLSLALDCLHQTASAQTAIPEQKSAPSTPEGKQLPPGTVDAPTTKRPSTKPVAPQAAAGRPRSVDRRSEAPRSTPQTSVPPLRQTQDARTGTVGVYSNSTSIATKTNTPLVNIPQSVSVVTREFIQDNAFQGVTDVTRYIPGFAVHQGEGNRDELVIRGVVPAPISSSTVSETTSKSFAIFTTRKV